MVELISKCAWFWRCASPQIITPTKSEAFTPSIKNRSNALIISVEGATDFYWQEIMKEHTSTLYNITPANLKIASFLIYPSRWYIYIHIFHFSLSLEYFLPKLLTTILCFLVDVFFHQNAAQWQWKKINDKFCLINDWCIASLQSDLRNSIFQLNYQWSDLDEGIQDFTESSYRTYHNCCLIKTQTLSWKNKNHG